MRTAKVNTVAFPVPKVEQSYFKRKDCPKCGIEQSWYSTWLNRAQTHGKCDMCGYEWHEKRLRG